MINKIWALFIIIGLIYAFITNNLGVINEEIFNSAKSSLNVVLEMFPVMALWLGIMNIATESGLMDKLARLLTPVLKHIFKDIPDNHISLSYISSNIIINMFGLGSAATPFGLKAMKSLQEINPNKEVASKSMITFLLINTCGVTLIPTGVISIRMLYGSVNPTITVLASVLVTIISLLLAIIIDKICRVVYD